MLRSFAAGGLIGERFGDGPPRILALHGWSRTHSDFSSVFEPVGAHPLDAIALDLPGFGVAPAPPRPWGSGEYAELVGQVIEEMVPPIVTLGHSFGGRVAIHMAASRPDQIGALVLSGVPFRRPVGVKRSPRPAYRAGRFLHRIGLLPETSMERLRQRYGSSDYRTAQGVMRQVLVRVVNEEYEELLESVMCPISLVWGADDATAPVATARSISDRFANASLVELAGVGHLTPLSAPEALRDAVVQALRSLEAPK